MAYRPPPIQNRVTEESLISTKIWAQWFQYVAQQADGFDNLIIVKKASDFRNIDSTKVYMIDGVVDMGTQSIEVPEGGISIAGLNGARDVSILTSSEDNYTMFTSPSGGYSGDVVIESLTITVGGANSKVYNLDNDENSNALDIIGVNYVSCTSLGELTDYRQILLDGVGFIFIDDGLMFNGTWSGGIRISTTVAVGFPAATLFKEGTSLVINGSVRSDINFLSVNAASVLFDFVPANITNDAEFSLVGVRTTATNAVPNLPSSSVKARVRDCIGIRDTYVGGEWTVSSAVATTIASANTLVKVAGTTTYSDLQWFSNTTNNAFVYDSDQIIEVQAQASLSFSGANNNVIGVQLRQWDDSASAYVDIGAKFTATLNSGGRTENLVAIARTALYENDRIEVWVENQTGTANITAEVGGFVGIQERAS